MALILTKNSVADLATINHQYCEYVMVRGVGVFGFTPTGTANGTTVFAALNDRFSAVGFWQLLVGGSGTALATPVLALAVISTTQIDATWGAISGASNYVLERGLLADFSDAAVVFSGSALSFNNTGLTLNTTYYFRLKAQGFSVIDSAYDTDSATTNAV